MFNEDLSEFFNDFSETVVYSNNGYSKQIKAIIDHDVNLIGYEGEIAGKTITFTIKSDDSIVVDGVFNYISDNYQIDSIISDDKKIMVVSVVKV